MKKENVDIGKLIDEETQRRLAAMQKKDYEWPTKAGKGDYIAIIAAFVACAVLIGLCMTGVIA